MAVFTVDPALKGALMDALLAEGEHVGDLSKEDDLRKTALELSEGLTAVIWALCHGFANPQINKLGEMLWNVLGSHLILTTIGLPVESVTFVGIRQGDSIQARVIIPLNWREMYFSDPVLQAGAVVSAGSKVIDVYNLKLDEHSERRALVYEAEFLLTVLHGNPHHPFNAYQRRVLEEFPEGLKSPKAEDLIYEWKPFFQATA
jgi:hypothetical protein